jgi:excisionase family DNA binding protein
MTKEEIKEILHILELDYEAEPSLIYVFYRTRDGVFRNFSISVRQGDHLSDLELVSLMRREYPATRQGDVVDVERPAMLPPAGERWLDTSDVCHLLKISRQTVSSWAKKGYLTPYCVGGRVYFSRTQIDHFIRSNAIDENGRLDKTAIMGSCQMT